MPSTAHPLLFTAFEMGGLRLPNRFVMPAMTRSRTPASGVPDQQNALYYAQRASAITSPAEARWA